MDKTIQWISTILSQIGKLDGDEGKAILEICGRECSKMDGLLVGAKKTKEGSNDKNDIEKLFNEFKKNYYDSPGLYKEENKIYLVFNECTCPMVKSGVGNEYLCNCTIGYTKQIFETLFDETVDVQLRHTILRGDKICEQIISV